MDAVFLPKKTEVVGADRWALLLLDACGKTHMVEPFEKLCAANRVLCWYGEPNMTDPWQPIDASIGKTCRDLALGSAFGVEAYLLKSKKNRQAWNGKKGDGKSFVNLQFKRLMALQFVGRAWAEIHDNPEYADMHANAWIKTSCLLTADGSDDDKVSPQGFPKYVVPA